jgi:NAD-dependent SIR2 family protein deacetylase
MADTAIKTEEEKKEFFDAPDILDMKVQMLAEMILASSHMVSFTGAGISTACGIPDYRSGFNTVLETGPGCWESAANKQKYKTEQKKMPVGKSGLRTSIQKAYPSKTHMALFELMEQGHLKHLVSQNVDGLHRKSGIKPENLSELHGNTNLEICEECGAEYMRDQRVRTAQKVKEHRTGRTCDNTNCNGYLKDTIINFGENLN